MESKQVIFSIKETVTFYRLYIILNNEVGFYYKHKGGDKLFATEPWEGKFIFKDEHNREFVIGNKVIEECLHRFSEEETLAYHNGLI